MLIPHLLDAAAALIESFGQNKLILAALIISFAVLVTASWVWKKVV